MAELFAGVGGFRIGLNRASKDYEVVWSNQWEPGTNNQAASEVYVERFGEKGHSNQDIAQVPIKDIPEHDLLVGGFPCQDYSVARTLSQSQGIAGKKGVLWWSIHNILDKSKNPPEFVFLENVDRLLGSPASQRGRDFAIILASLADLGYIVEWRIINAAEYGMPQRRRRVFILGYKKGSKVYQKAKDADPKRWISSDGTIAKAFKIDKKKSSHENDFKIEGDLAEITEKFNKKGKASPFQNCGVMIDRKVWTSKVYPKYTGKKTFLKEILLPDKEVPKEFFITKDLDKWKYLKGGKKEQRFSKKHNTFFPYNEGSMVFPDNLNAPSRTIVTGEGGASPSRFKHVVKAGSRKLRRLTPLELERLNMFPDNHTASCPSDVKRAFFMGNALVVGVIEKIGKSLVTQLK